METSIRPQVEPDHFHLEMLVTLNDVETYLKPSLVLQVVVNVFQLGDVIRTIVAASLQLFPIVFELLTRVEVIELDQLVVDPFPSQLLLSRVLDTGDLVSTFGVRDSSTELIIIINPKRTYCR